MQRAQSSPRPLVAAALRPLAPKRRVRPERAPAVPPLPAMLVPARTPVSLEAPAVLLAPA